MVCVYLCIHLQESMRSEKFDTHQQALSLNCERKHPDVARCLIIPTCYLLISETLKLCY